ncbi:Uncharacterized protein APZ42_028616 [Daphnia magna]|uniref:Uncharacterized protein n=1 Tax=Daphnia magna TaxID=35525 RepID=A0A164Q6L4_9CRUS|nr:Uncharacterized protein APZ42_028616 [Daphnia magna]
MDEKGSRRQGRKERRSNKEEKEKKLFFFFFFSVGGGGVVVVVEVRRRKREANIIKLVARWVEQTSHFAGCVQPRHAEKRVLFLFLSFSF